MHHGEMPPNLAHLQPVLDIALDAVVAMNPAGNVVAWNAVAERIFGWTAAEAIGRPMSALIIPQEHREAHRKGLERFLATGEKRILDRRIEIMAVDQSGRTFPIELAVTFTRLNENPVFVGFLRDISERKRAEILLQRQAVEARLLFEVTRLAADTASVEEALRACLQAICQLTGWAVGHAFVVVEGLTPELVSTNIWYEEAPGLAASIGAATDRIRFSAGIGLPGSILQTGEPRWISDARTEDNFPRKDSVYGAAFGFPIKSEGRIVAILEFFARERIEPAGDLLLTVRTLGEQVGRVLERKRTEEHQRLMTRELNHRVRNNLAIIQSIAHQTFSHVGAKAALAAFESRVGALAAAHEVLTREDWQAASLRDLAQQTLFGCGGDEHRTAIEGPEVSLPPRTAVALTMALHELCTNAVKYGAFSVPSGRVSLSWSVDPSAEGGRLRIDWRESGGPPVAVPDRRGFGSRMIERALARELAGNAEMRFRPEGLHCVIKAPIPAARLAG